MDAFISLLELAVCGVASILSIGFVRHLFQRWADKMRRTYELEIPRGMTHDQVLAFLRAVLGELPRPKFLQPAYTLVLEKYGDANGKRYFLHMPGHVRTNIDQLLEATIEGVGIQLLKDDDDKIANTVWEQATELSMRGTIKPLRIDDEKRIAVAIDAKFRNLTADQALVLQWVVIPDRPRDPSTGDKEKLTDFTMHAVARMAAKGENAAELLLNLQASFRGVSSSHSTLKRRVMLGVGNRVNRRAGTLGYPIFLNAKEFSAIMGWELDGMAGQRARRLEAHSMIDTKGIVVGAGNHHKSRGRPLAITPASLMMHTWILGPSGVGKSTVLHNMATQIMNQGMGLVLIEPKGDLAHDVLMSVPHSRINDVIWFDPSDTQHPIGLNVLAGHDVDLITSHIEGMFHNIFHDSWGDRLARILRLGVKTAAINGLTLFDVRHLLMNPEFRSKEIIKLRKYREHHDLILEWRWLDSITDIAVDSVINKLDNFLGSRTLRNILGQHDGLNMSDVVDKRKILLVPLPSALIGQTNTSALGSLMRELLWDEIRRRPMDKRQPIILMMDEFQNYADLNTSKSDPFAEARSYGLGLVIANQHSGQLSNAVFSSVANNTGSKIVFGLEPEDGHKLKNHFVPLTPDDLNTLPKFSVAARLLSSAGKAPVVTAMTAPPPMPTGAGHAALAASRAVYGRPVNDVETEFVERHKSIHEERKRPTIGKVVE